MDQKNLLGKNDSLKELNEKSLDFKTKFFYGLSEFNNKIIQNLQGFYLNAFLLEVAGVKALWAGNLLLISK